MSALRAFNKLGLLGGLANHFFNFSNSHLLSLARLVFAALTSSLTSSFSVDHRPVHLLVEPMGISASVLEDCLGAAAGAVVRLDAAVSNVGVHPLDLCILVYHVANLIKSALRGR